MGKGRNTRIVEDNGFKIVVIDNIKFKGKKRIDWENVEEYLKQYLGRKYTIASTGDVIHIGHDFPDEYTHSKYTQILKGATAKAKANATQGIPEMIEIATGKHFEENRKEKHNSNAKFGWYRYDSYFALPVYEQDGKLESYNVFQASMLVRHSKDNKMYLYDIINIKKETRKLFRSNDLTQ